MDGNRVLQQLDILKDANYKLQHQDELLPTEQSKVTMMRELISFGRAMTCRSDSVASQTINTIVTVLLSGLL